MREQFYLALPMKPLCREDCKGLCPQCGTNLNTGTCECRPEWEDPRLAALKALIQNGRPTMPNPKRRHSKTRGRKRRTHDALTGADAEPVPAVPRAKAAAPRVPDCGYYNGGRSRRRRE